MRTKFGILGILFFKFCLAEQGVLLLNSWTFNKTIQAFPFSLVKFDKKSPSGPKHQVFQELAQDLIKTENILLAEVRIAGYGSPENHDLSERFGLSQGILPEFILFKRKAINGKNYDHEITRYGGEVDVDNLRRFLKLKTGEEL